MATTQSQINGTANSSQQQLPSTQNAQAAPQAATTNAQPSTPPNGTTRPRDARLIELLLTSQGVTAYEQRVPLLLMDFAYRHTSSILSDALHLSGDPYITQAGAKASASASAAVIPGGDAYVTANAVKLAIGARLSYQFRGGSGGGGISKEYMQELARERNKISLPKIVPSEWGVRLPSERFVLSGASWGLKETWDELNGDNDSDSEDEDRDMNQVGDDAMEGIEAPPIEEGGDPVEGGTVEDMFGQDVDEEMEG